MSGTANFPDTGYNGDRRRLFFTQLTDRLRAAPGVESVGIANCPPVSGGCSSTSPGSSAASSR